MQVRFLIQYSGGRRKDEVKEISPEEVIKELSKISKNTGVKLNEDINDLEGLKKEFFKFKELVSNRWRQWGAVVN